MIHQDSYVTEIWRKEGWWEIMLISNPSNHIDVCHDDLFIAWSFRFPLSHSCRDQDPHIPGQKYVYLNLVNCVLNENSGLICLMIHLFVSLAACGICKTFLQLQSSQAWILLQSCFFKFHLIIKLLVYLKAFHWFFHSLFSLFALATKFLSFPSAH